jgi:hypothetical protein
MLGEYSMLGGIVIGIGAALIGMIGLVGATLVGHFDDFAPPRD